MPQPNYSSFRPVDRYWVGYWERRMGAEAFRAYRDKVYAFLVGMEPGTRRVDGICREENRELFIKLICQYIEEGNGDVHFSDDYTEIRKSNKE